METQPASKKGMDPNATAVTDDEYSRRKGSEKTYYSMAHALREPVSEQPQMLTFGQLKQYQVSVQVLELWLQTISSWIKLCMYTIVKCVG